jgi:hypothetical protein
VIIVKIVMGADQYPEYINGAATFTARLAAGLARAGHTVDVLWPSAHGGHDLDSSESHGDALVASRAGAGLMDRELAMAP